MRWKQRPQHANWGDFGPDDEKGRMNLLTPARRLAAMREVKEGIAFTLSLPLDYPGGAEGSPRQPPKLYATTARGHACYNCSVDMFFPGSRGIQCDDGVNMDLQYSTQWDGLMHWGRMFDADADGVEEAVYYNGFRAGEHIIGPDAPGGPCAKNLGIQNLAEACPQGRGVLVNFHAIHGRARMGFGYDAVMRAMEAQGAEVEKGDFLLSYTGLDRVIMEMNKRMDPVKFMGSCGGLDGHDDALLKWIDDSGIVAICSDNVAVEFLNPKVGPNDVTGMRLHERCLFDLGIHLGEMWWLADLADWLAAHRRSAFLLTAPPLRLPGAAGSPACPIATV